MKLRLILVTLSIIVIADLVAHAQAIQSAVSPPVTSVNGQTGNVTTPASAVLPGTYTIANLPPCAQNQAKYAFDTDLGGGADMVLCDGTNWKHIRQGVVTQVPATSTITLTPLASPPIIQFTGSGLALTMNINVLTQNIYPGYQVRLIFPSGVLTAASAVGISLNGGNTANLGNLGGYWEDIQYNGTSLVEIAKGLL